MQNYHKLIGGIVGSFLGFGVNQFGVPEMVASPEFVDWVSQAIIAGFASLGVWRAPKNQSAR